MFNLFEILDTEKARFNFMKGLINLAKVQEVDEGVRGINSEELTFIKNAMDALKISDTDQVKLEKLVDDHENIVDITFDNKKQAVFFLREGLQICYIEGRFYQSEKEMINKMAARLGVSDDTVNKLIEWVEEGMRLSAQGISLLELEG